MCCTTATPTSLTPAPNALCADRAQNGQAGAAWLDAVLHCTRILFLQRLRTPRDRQQAASIVTARFVGLGAQLAGASWPPQLLRDPSGDGRAAVRLLPGRVSVGRAACACEAAQRVQAPGETASVDCW